MSKNPKIFFYKIFNRYLKVSKEFIPKDAPAPELRFFKKWHFFIFDPLVTEYFLDQKFKRSFDLNSTYPNVQTNEVW
jgi:hypothetical protein